MLPIGADEKPASLARQSLRKTNIFPSCSFGESRIFVNFGTLNTREPKAAVNLSPYISRCPYNLYPEISFSVEISALGATGLSEIKLPILNDTTNELCVLLSHDPSAAKIISRIFEERMDSAGKGVLISTAIALLRHLKECLGSKLESLVEDYTLPILEKDSIEFIGTVTFDCLIVTPYPHPHADATLIEPHEIWNPNGPTQVVGHRGMSSTWQRSSFTDQHEVLDKIIQHLSVCRLARTLTSSDSKLEIASRVVALLILRSHSCPRLLRA